MMDQKGRYKVFTLHLDQLDIHGDLKDLVQKGLNQFIHKKEISLLNAGYSCHLMTAITTMET